MILNVLKHHTRIHFPFPFNSEVAGPFIFMKVSFCTYCSIQNGCLNLMEIKIICNVLLLIWIFFHRILTLVWIKKFSPKSVTKDFFFYSKYWSQELLQVSLMWSVVVQWMMPTSFWWVWEYLQGTMNLAINIAMIVLNNLVM